MTALVQRASLQIWFWSWPSELVRAYKYRRWAKHSLRVESYFYRAWSQLSW
jgi:hypothetical protein